MSRFDFTNFERQGNIDKDIQLNDIEETRQLIVENAGKALRSVKIYTPDLEHTLYNNDDFRQQLLNFTRGNRHAQIQILVDDISNPLHNGHMLIPLAQQLTSALTIKNTPVDYLGTNISFIVYDQNKFIFRPDRMSHYSIYSECRHRSEKLMEFFTPAWEQAEKDIHTARLSI